MGADRATRGGIDEDHRGRHGVLCGPFGNVEHDDAEHHADLRRGKPDARSLVHRLQHVVGEDAHLVVDDRDGLGLLAQLRLWNDEDRTEGHGTAKRGDEIEIGASRGEVNLPARTVMTVRNGDHRRSDG